MKPIAKGDLVQVVRAAPCCKSEKDIGHAFTVDRVAVIAGMCNYCGQQSQSLNVAYEAGEGPWDAYRLQRIEPLEEKDEIEELTAISIYEDLTRETT